MIPRRTRSLRHTTDGHWRFISDQSRCRAAAHKQASSLWPRTRGEGITVELNVKSGRPGYPATCLIHLLQFYIYTCYVSCPRPSISCQWLLQCSLFLWWPGTQVSHVDCQSMHLVRLTKMEVVVLCVAQRNQEANDVNKCCRRVSSKLFVCKRTTPGCSFKTNTKYSRLPDGFLPMYFFW